MVSTFHMLLVFTWPQMLMRWKKKRRTVAGANQRSVVTLIYERLLVRDFPYNDFNSHCTFLPPHDRKIWSDSQNNLHG